MQSVFKYSLNDIELENINAFSKTVDYCSIEQVPGWTKLYPTTKFCFFYIFNETGMKSYAQIIENQRFAQINFGPVCTDKNVMIDSLKEIIEYYKKKKFIFLGIQLFYKSGYETDYIEYKLNNLYKINYVFDNWNTKSSIEIDLNADIESIFRHFSKGHKSDIKKAQKLGIYIEELNSVPDLHVFNDIFTKMCNARHIDRGELRSDAVFDIYNLLNTQNRGKILLAKDNEHKIIGGIILVSQGVTLRYFKGASDPDLRHLPVTHLLIFEAIKYAKIQGFKYFDFWGINHFAEMQDHIYNVNHFKKGFGGYYTFLAKKMNISLIPFGFLIYKTSMLLKKKMVKFNLLKIKQ